jgi:hypothetical protein
MPEILLVLDRLDPTAGVLESNLWKAMQGNAEPTGVTTVNSMDAAERKLPKEVMLVITTMNIRSTPDSPLNPEEPLGLELLKWMSGKRMKIPSILITPTNTPELERARPDLFQFRVVYTGGNMIKDLLDRAKEAIENIPPKCLDVEIELVGSSWKYRLKSSSGWRNPRDVWIRIPATTLAAVLALSHTIDTTSDRWHNKFTQVGQLLMEEFFRNSGFRTDFETGLANVGNDVRKTRVRFVVKPHLHGIALEALPRPRTKDEFWILEAPVYRRIQIDETADGDLFERGEPISCLIIESPSSGSAELASVRIECEWLRAKVKELAVRDVEELVVMRKDSEDRELIPTAHNVSRMLGSRQWSIVHYAGHSHFDGKDGWIFLPDSRGQDKMQDIRRFGEWLRKAKLTYFSSCDSGAGPFVFELAKRRVPSIVGFRWPIDDELALEFAQQFYTSLFATRSLERSFLTARQTLNVKYPTDPIWASPVLIKQSGEF